MSSTTTPNFTRTKANLTVASLINCGTSGISNSSSQSQDQPVTKTEAQSTKIITTVKDVPTVANADLLYKNISSSVMSPLKSSSSLTANYTLQQYSNIINSNACKEASSSNPLTNIRTLTNAITTSSLETFVAESIVQGGSQFQGKTPYIPILPAAKDSKSKTNSTLIEKNGKMAGQSKKFLQKNAIFVPRGWNRIVEKDHITYVR